MDKKQKRTWTIGWLDIIYDLKTGGLVDACMEEDPAVFETEEEARACFAKKKAYFKVDGRRLVVENYELESSTLTDDGREERSMVDTTYRYGGNLELLRALAKFSDWSFTDEAQDSLDYRVWKDTSSWQPVEGFLSFVKETIQ